MEVSEIEKGEEDYFIIYVDIKDSVTERSDEYLYYNSADQKFRIYFREPVYYVNDFDILDMCISEPNYILMKEEDTITITTSSGNTDVSIVPDSDGVVTMNNLAVSLRNHFDVIIDDNILYLSSETNFSLTFGSGFVNYLGNSSFKSILPSVMNFQSSGNILLQGGDIALSSSSGSSSGSFTILPGSLHLTSSGTLNQQKYSTALKFNFDKTKELLGNIMFHCDEIQSGMPHPPLYKSMQGLYKYIWSHSNRYVSDIDHNKFKPIQKVIESRGDWNINRILLNHHAFAEFSLRLRYLINSKNQFKSEVDVLAKSLRDTILEGVEYSTKPRSSLKE